MLSTVLILPDDLKDEGNRMGDAMGWGPENFSVALSSDGSAPATHWGLHAWASDDFPAYLASETLPPELEKAGFTQKEWDAIRAAIIQSYWSDYIGHFDTVCAENNFQVVEDQGSIG